MANFLKPQRALLYHDDDDDFCFSSFDCYGFCRNRCIYYSGSGQGHCEQNTGCVVGAIIGAFIFVVVIAYLIYFYNKRRRLRLTGGTTVITGTAVSYPQQTGYPQQVAYGQQQQYAYPTAQAHPVQAYPVQAQPAQAQPVQAQPVHAYPTQQPIQMAQPVQQSGNPIQKF